MNLYNHHWTLFVDIRRGLYFVCSKDYFLLERFGLSFLFHQFIFSTIRFFYEFKIKYCSGNVQRRSTYIAKNLCEMKAGGNKRYTVYDCSTTTTFFLSDFGLLSPARVCFLLRSSLTLLASSIVCLSLAAWNTGFGTRRLLHTMRNRDGNYRHMKLTL